MRFVVRRAAAPIASGSTPWRQSPGITSTSRPSREATLLQSVANWPVSAISTLSPGESVFTSAASQPPLPDAGHTITGPLVLNTGFASSTISSESFANAGPR